jgi:hypothetical protein
LPKQNDKHLQLDTNGEKNTNVHGVGFVAFWLCKVEGGLSVTCDKSGVEAILYQRNCGMGIHFFGSTTGIH